MQISYWQVKLLWQRKEYKAAAKQLNKWLKEKLNEYTDQSSTI